MAGDGVNDARHSRRLMSASPWAPARTWRKVRASRCQGDLTGIVRCGDYRRRPCATSAELSSPRLQRGRYPDRRRRALSRVRILLSPIIAAAMALSSVSVVGMRCGCGGWRCERGAVLFRHGADPG